MKKKNVSWLITISVLVIIIGLFIVINNSDLSINDVVNHGYYAPGGSQWEFRATSEFRGVPCFSEEECLALCEKEVSAYNSVTSDFIKCTKVTGHPGHIKMYDFTRATSVGEFKAWLDEQISLSLKHNYCPKNTKSWVNLYSLGACARSNTVTDVEVVEICPYDNRSYFVRLWDAIKGTPYNEVI